MVSTLKFFITKISDFHDNFIFHIWVLLFATVDHFRGCWVPILLLDLELGPINLTFIRDLDSVKLNQDVIYLG